MLLSEQFLVIDLIEKVIFQIFQKLKKNQLIQNILLRILIRSIVF